MIPPSAGIRLTKGVSFGPQINASQVKKSDSDIGPVGHRTIYQLVHVRKKIGVGCSGKHRPAVNIPSGDPAACQGPRQRTHPMVMNQASCIIPPAVSCLYSVMRRLSAVAFPALEFIGCSPILTNRRNNSKWWFVANFRRSIHLTCRSWDRPGCGRSTSGSTGTGTRFQ